MGTYLNPGAAAFVEALNSEIFVDKTPMIQQLNAAVKTKQKYVSVSRPRRFGKTMAADMICAYYGRGADSRVLFQGSKLSAFKNWDRYYGYFDVIRVVMTDFCQRNRTVSASLEVLKRRILNELHRVYPEVQYEEEDLAYSLDQFYQSSKVQFVIVIDEWDAVFREYPEDREGQTTYLNFLRDILKDKEYVALAYITGILPIKKYGKHSALNMFDEYSMIYPMQLARFAGFTEDEVAVLCKKYGRDFDSLKEWYDGYRVSDVVPADPDHRTLKETGKSPEPGPISLYSPLSVVKAIQTGIICNYWNNTETYEALERYISMNFDGLKESTAMLMNGGKCRIDISTYQNDMTTFHSRDDILTMLIHLGYLGFDASTQEVFIPNKEVLDVFRASTRKDSWQPVFRLLADSQRLLEATWAEDAQTVASILEETHLLSGADGYHSEEGLRYAIQLAYYSAENYYMRFRELETGKGYADLVYIPRPEYANKPALLIELKYGKPATTAIEQIHEREYPKGLEAYKGNLLLIGISYRRDRKPENKRHTCIIEHA